MHRPISTTYVHTHARTDSRLRRAAHSALTQALTAPAASATRQSSHTQSHTHSSCCRHGHAGLWALVPIQGLHWEPQTHTRTHTCTREPCCREKSRQWSLTSGQDTLPWPGTGPGQPRVATSSLLRGGKHFLSLYSSFSLLFPLQITLIPLFLYLRFLRWTACNKQLGNVLRQHPVMGPIPSGNVFPPLPRSTRCFGAPVHWLWWALELSLPWGSCRDQGRGLGLSDRVTGVPLHSAVPLRSFVCVCVHVCMHVKREACFVSKSLSCNTPGSSRSRVLFVFPHLLQFIWAPLGTFTEELFITEPVITALLLCLFSGKDMGLKTVTCVPQRFSQ